MKKTLAFLLLFCVAACSVAAPFALSGCSVFGISSTSTPATVSAPVRAALRGAVLMAKDAWVTAGDACVAAQALPTGMPAACLADLPQAHDDIVAAAEAVDALDSAAVSAPAEAVCQLTEATADISATIPGLGSAGAELVTLAADAVEITKALGVCLPTDAGPKDGGVQ